MSQELVRIDFLRKQVEQLYKKQSLDEIKHNIREILGNYERNNTLQQLKLTDLNKEVNVFIGQEDYKKNRFTRLFDDFSGKEELIEQNLQEFEIKDFDINNIEDLQLQADLLDVDADIDTQLRKTGDIQEDQFE
ncbi:hypothetical protein SS50377_27007 [Spironucleus salmonicida]|uniref:Uncharacterized protein n=1 Tax=Spironucleus salmonicida TaxID=348837 RepID=V6M2N4_9EUKA|nr:hypothetical protein SS50377_27007 [Spironucleus salmonicida]|eukprot:EST47519.1 Hypothetical protein SS50377_12504 [Spironucleus salmonicida]